MKKLLMVLMAVGMFSALPVLAAEHGDMKMDMHEGMKMDTEEGMRQCALQAESIQQKITRLNAEVKSGKSTHSAKELKDLENKLKETNKLLEDMNKGGN